MKLWKNRKRNMSDKPVGKRSIHNPNELNTSLEIPMYAPNQGLIPKEYQVSGQLCELETDFKGKCMEFLSKSNPDCFNSSYMDAVIERIGIEAVNFIKIQRSDHLQIITKLLYGMHKGDYAKCKSKLEDFRSDKERNTKKLEKYRRIYYSGTSLEEEECI